MKRANEEILYKTCIEQESVFRSELILLLIWKAKSALQKYVLTLPASGPSGNSCLLNTFANSLDLDQNCQKVGPDLDPSLWWCSRNNKKKISRQQQKKKHEKLPCMKKYPYTWAAQPAHQHTDQHQCFSANINICYIQYSILWLSRLV